MTVYLSFTQLQHSFYIKKHIIAQKLFFLFFYHNFFNIISISRLTQTKIQDDEFNRALK